MIWALKMSASIVVFGDEAVGKSAVYRAAVGLDPARDAFGRGYRKTWGSEVRPTKVGEHIVDLWDLGHGPFKMENIPNLVGGILVHKGDLPEVNEVNFPVVLLNNHKKCVTGQTARAALEEIVQLALG